MNALQRVVAQESHSLLAGRFMRGPLGAREVGRENARVLCGLPTLTHAGVTVGEAVQRGLMAAKGLLESIRAALSLPSPLSSPLPSPSTTLERGGLGR